MPNKDDTMTKVFTHLKQHALVSGFQLVSASQTNGCKNENLRQLNVAPSAAYDSYETSCRASCFKGTRVKVLTEIASWAASDDETLAPIYVLDGVAGIGKSTISKTVAERAAETNALGASFFFSRDEERRKSAKSFFPTIAFQLAHFGEEFAKQIDAALLRNPNAVAQGLPKQFSSMIVEPLKDFFAATGNPILIVIDALDECEEGADTLLKILADAIKNMPRLKVFITTRPERHLRTVLDRYRHLKRFHLHDIEALVVQSDIRLYLEFHLSLEQVQHALPELEYPWQPAKKDMDILVNMSGTLFIIASTITRFILDGWQSDPAQQLSRLLEDVSHKDFSGSKYTTVMDVIYMQILRSAIPHDSGGSNPDFNFLNGWFARYQIVMGTILVLQHPLPGHVLASLVGISFSDINRALLHLHSLVAPTNDLNMTFRIHHKSFPDFITSSSRCHSPEFLINMKSCHLQLGKWCLQIMDSCLRPNMCNLSSTERYRNNIETRCLTQNCISQEIAYACTHWATHLISAETLNGTVEQLLECFASKHLLTWLEVLSTIGQIDTAYLSLDMVGKLLVSVISSYNFISRY